MIIQLSLCALSFIPSILTFFYLRSFRKDDEVYHKDCQKLLFSGFGICALVMLFGLVLRLPWVFLGLGKNNPMLENLFMCFVITALCEETAKFLAARKYIYKDTGKTSRLDVYAYITIAALSFALLEDVIYAISSNAGQIIVRGVLMGHVPEALIMAHFYSKAVEEKKTVYKVLAFLLPILLHGTYNFLLKDGLPEWTAMVELTLVAVETICTYYTLFFFLRKKKDDPAYTRPIFTQE